MFVRIIPTGTESKLLTTVKKGVYQWKFKWIICNDENIVAWRNSRVSTVSKVEIYLDVLTFHFQKSKLSKYLDSVESLDSVKRVKVDLNVKVKINV